MKRNSSGCHRLFCICAGLLGLSAVLLLSWIPPASAQMMLIDDFNDLNDDGWTRVDSTDGQTWGPAIIDVNGKGEYRFESGGPVGLNIPGVGFVTSIWDESSDPQYSEGYLRTRIRIGENFTTAGLGMRFTGSLETGFNGYLFRIATDDEPFDDDPRDNPPGSMRIGLAANSEILGDVALDFPFVVDEELMLEAGAVGNELSMKVWRVGEDEPPEPQLVIEESTYSTGQFLVETNATGDIFISRASAVFDDIYFTPAGAGAVVAAGVFVPEPGGLSAMLVGASCLALVTRPRWIKHFVAQSNCPVTPTQGLRNGMIMRCTLLVALALSATAQAQVTFDLGTLTVDGDPLTGPIPLSIPAGTYNSYRLTTDWSSLTPDDPETEDDEGAWSREVIWALSDGHLNAPDTTFYANPGDAPGSAPNSDPVTLEWDDFLDLPVTGPVDLSLLNLQTFTESEGQWANAVLEISFETPPPPPALDADLGIVAREFRPIHLATSGDFDTELAVYSSTGAMLRRNDDAPGAVVHSEINFEFGLPIGEYVAVLGGFNTSFEDGYAITPGTAAGDFGISVAGAQFAGALAADQLAYVGFRVAPVPEPTSLALCLCCGLFALAQPFRGGYWNRRS